MGEKKKNNNKKSGRVLNYKVKLGSFFLSTVHIELKHALCLQQCEQCGRAMRGTARGRSVRMYAENSL